MLAQQAHGLRAGDRLDAPHVGGARRLAEDVKEADLGSRAHVRTAAQLARVLALADLHHAHDLAVLLSEQRHRAQPLGLLERRRDRAHRIVGQDPLVHAVLDIPELLLAQALAVAEVEAELVRADIGARLAHVGADALAQRRLKQVRGRVIRLGGMPGRMVDPREHLLARLQLAALHEHRQRLIVAQAKRRPPPARASPSAASSIVPPSATWPPPGA